MKITQGQAFKRLLKKLSAMRATLRNDEREILDEIVTGEVEAHKLSVDRAASKAAAKASAGKAAEVAAHKLSAGKAASRAAGRADFRIDIDPRTGQYLQIED
jgi:hypothetical protein